jgi:hypothetical protein
VNIAARIRANLPSADRYVGIFPGRCFRLEKEGAPLAPTEMELRAFGFCDD